MILLSVSKIHAGIYSNHCIICAYMWPAAVRCTREVLTNPDNGVVAMTNGNVFQSVATYTCNEGFTVIGNATRVCGANGEWSSSTPECQGT